MFIVNLTYIVPLEKVDDYIDAHIEYLNIQYEKGHFLASGRKIPRDGGIILSNVESREALMAILEMDPFKINNLAEYSVTEFVPSKTADALSFLRES